MNKEPIVYLDQMHWIHLAQAATDHTEGEKYKSAYDRLLELSSAGSITVVLSLTNYMELAKTGSYKNRSDVANVMAKLTGLKTLPSIHRLSDYETEQYVRSIYSLPPLPEIDTIGIGFSFIVNGRNQMLTMNYPDPNISKLFIERLGGEEAVKKLEYEFTARNGALNRTEP
jgi:hypothetical protein